MSGMALRKTEAYTFHILRTFLFCRIPKGKLSLLRKWHITNCSSWKTKRVYKIIYTFQDVQNANEKKQESEVVAP